MNISCIKKKLIENTLSHNLRYKNTKHIKWGKTLLALSLVMPLYYIDTYYYSYSIIIYISDHSIFQYLTSRSPIRKPAITDTVCKILPVCKTVSSICHGRINSYFFTMNGRNETRELSAEIYKLTYIIDITHLFVPIAYKVSHDDIS